MATTRFNPFGEMDRLLSDAMRTPAAAPMPMDLYRHNEQFVAHIDLPGVDPSSIDVDVEDHTLTIRAERAARQGEDLQWLSRERPSGTFARQLTLGHGVATDRIEAEYTDGVLTLVIPVAEEAKPRKISVSHRQGQQRIESGEHQQDAG
ncbi:Hsp20/alpha crystallin family protein [Ornithinimicrobium sediminis]|uniref:Hsp20/alpha crystallin family protein n=1 Tax=Ornithinimicrobium sediminis TaxID=2904603 RepID=UPI001E31AED3|nr:Hsp20/alpha crystallin family protein [Ornithinimicrobium sediminis]MCE0487036.1 Hsp20/alpha crystallin family protein [Ornithinimicrobium sediminis]